MFEVNQLICHAIGDYILQSEWMANQKTKSHIPAMVHAFAYSIPFWFLKPSLLALGVIISTHFVIDRWRLARYVVWLKNWLCPFWMRIKAKVTGIISVNHITVDAVPSDISMGDIVTARDNAALTVGDEVMFYDINGKPKRKYVFPWKDCVATGYPPNTPPFLAVWLLIITDNLMHIVINAAALKYL